MFFYVFLLKGKFYKIEFVGMSKYAHLFQCSGSGSVSQKSGTGCGSSHHQAKLQKTLDFYCCVTSSGRFICKV